MFLPICRSFIFYNWQLGNKCQILGSGTDAVIINILTKSSLIELKIKRGIFYSFLKRKNEILDGEIEKLEKKNRMYTGGFYQTSLTMKSVFIICEQLGNH